MRVVICPDKFAGTLSAVEVGDAIAEGWREVAPADTLIVRPLSDGGPGFVEVLAAAPLSGHARQIAVSTTDPLGRPASGSVLLDGDVAYIESAQACGLHLLAEGERDPKWTSTFGLGPLVLTAAEVGARRIVVGLGGSATNDAGAGLLAALGAAPLDEAGFALEYGGAALLRCASLGGAPRLRGAALVAATDVDNPLTGPHGASAVYGPQKGASGDDIVLLDAALTRFSQVLEKDLEFCPPGLAALPGSGAAGGLGAALLALGGRVESGIGLVWRLAGLDAVLDGADLVITGEGSFDEQSLRGKVVAGVAGAASGRGVPCAVIAGQVSADRREAAQAGVTETHSLVDHFGDLAAALTRPTEGLRQIGGRLARQRSR
jgi:glycerate kinase